MNQRGHAGRIQMSALHEQVKPNAPVNPPVLQNKQASNKTKRHTFKWWRTTHVLLILKGQCTDSCKCCQQSTVWENAQQRQSDISADKSQKPMPPPLQRISKAPVCLLESKPRAQPQGTATAIHPSGSALLCMPKCCSSHHWLALPAGSYTCASASACWLHPAFPLPLLANCFFTILQPHSTWSASASLQQVPAPGYTTSPQSAVIKTCRISLAYSC